MADEHSGYDYEEDPVMWDSPEENFADLNDTPDYEALSDFLSVEGAILVASQKNLLSQLQMRRHHFLHLQ
jgi:hypothetical protein